MEKYNDAKKSGGGTHLSDAHSINKRNYGIDVLKTLAAVMILILHLLGNGGVLKNCAVNSSQYYTAWFFEIASYCAVNCFGMITGYLMIDRNFKSTRLLEIWGQMLFYGIIVHTAMTLFMPAKVTLIDWVKTFLPITFKQHWYVSAYSALFLFGPYINKLLNSITKKQFAVLTYGCIGLFSLVTTASIINFDPFNINGGYGLLWLIALYIIGAYIKKFEIGQQMNKCWFLIGYFLSVIITLLSISFIRFVTSKIIGSSISEMLLVEYTSPTVVFMGIMLLLYFQKTKVPAKFQKTTAKISSLSFAIFLIHTVPAFYRVIIGESMTFLTNKNPLVIVGVIFGVTISFSIVSLVVEFLRVKLFQIFCLDKLIQKMGKMIDELLYL